MQSRAADTKLAEWLALVQGLYWATTGIWPTLHRTSFEAITGPKVDYWAVETAGALIASCGVVFLLARWRRHVSLEIGVLAILTASSLAAVDIFYGGPGRISRIYLLDAAAEIILVLGWIAWLVRRRRHRPGLSAPGARHH